MSVYTLDSLPELLSELADNETVRCVVITGEGENVFDPSGCVSLAFPRFLDEGSAARIIDVAASRGVLRLPVTPTVPSR